MKRVFLGSILLCCALAAQTASNQFTNGARNGRYWLWMDPSARTTFLVGFSEAMHVADAETRRMFFDVGVSVFGELQRGVDQFYDDPANASIPIASAISVWALKSNGATAEMVDAYIANLRRLSKPGPQR